MLVRVLGKLRKVIHGTLTKTVAVLGANTTCGIAPDDRMEVIATRPPVILQQATAL